MQFPFSSCKHNSNLIMFSKIKLWDLLPWFFEDYLRGIKISVSQIRCDQKGFLPYSDMLFQLLLNMKKIILTFI